ncbi:MAG: DoxX family protein [Myxococcaceae bacterium]
MRRAKPIIRVVTAIVMTIAGALHFIAPEPYLRMMPSFLPWHEALVAISGVFEMLGGIGLLIPRVRWVAAVGLVALFIAVFPANINMAVNHISLDPAHPIAPWLLWARLPLQFLFIATAWWLRKPT